MKNLLLTLCICCLMVGCASVCPQIKDSVYVGDFTEIDRDGIQISVPTYFIEHLEPVIQVNEKGEWLYE